MKHALFTLGCLLIAAIFISADTSDSPSKPSIEGVWELEHQFIYENDAIVDTLYNTDGYRQVKMYSKGRVMWTRFNPADSNEWFGFGVYEVKDGVLEERLEYASDAMMKIVDTVQVFRFDLEITKKHYSQTSHDADGNRYVSENYVRLE